MRTPVYKLKKCYICNSLYKPKHGRSMYCGQCRKKHDVQGRTTWNLMSSRIITADHTAYGDLKAESERILQDLRRIIGKGGA
jgi:hypothetical protein